MKAHEQAASFELQLGFAPSFHRDCSIRISSNGVTGLALFDSHPIGLLPGISLTLPVKPSCLKRLQGCCLSMLAEWDERWSDFGMDGISVNGSFTQPDEKPRAFALWSPKKISPPHKMISAVFDCFPFDYCSGAAGAQLELMRSYFDLQPPATIVNQSPLHLRLAPWVHRKDAAEIEAQLHLLPDSGELIIDTSGVERWGPVLANILPVAQLLNRSGTVYWKVRDDFADELIALGAKPSAIEVVPQEWISHEGHPIVFGDLVISSPEVIALASHGSKVDLIRALRQEYGLKIVDASKAAEELLGIFAVHARCAH